ncbi:MAG TPA: hypothetical protein VGL42_04615 [Opitutaceae bacterium]|jgi:hypothetical protein
MKLTPWQGLALTMLSLATVRADEPAAFRNFHSAIYAPVQIVQNWVKPGELEHEWSVISTQLHVDHVYIETYRDRRIADADVLERAKAFFSARGVQVSGGMALSSNQGGQFQSFCYTDLATRAYVAHVSAYTAQHFDDVMLDDFFFNNTKFPSDIAAKGSRSWTDFRLQLMDEVARDLILAPARAANPRVRIVIKFPNWYEHFQANGYDLAKEPQLFGEIYTGTETREAEITDQNLQAYESFGLVRFFHHVAPEHNGGGWVDTYDIKYVDRYAEQLWDTMLARAPEITLFNWLALLQPVAVGTRSWAGLPTTFELKSIDLNHATTARAAAVALQEVDHALDNLGQPLGVPAYKPLNSVGEDFLPNFLGMAGIPIDLRPDFPAEAPLVLLTESAAADPHIVAEIQRQLLDGKSVVITSGLLRALSHRGIQDIAEIEDTGETVCIDQCFGAFGPGAGRDLGRIDGARPALIPKLRFMTNDAWPLVRTVAGDQGFPLLLMDRYAGGALYVLTVPGNYSDLYRLPSGVLDILRHEIAKYLPVQLEGPAKLALFPYDNRTFVVESYLSQPVDAGISVAESQVHLRALDGDGAALRPVPPASSAVRHGGPPEVRSHFTFAIQPHSFRVFRLESD